MDVDFKITAWERVSIPEKFREEVEHALKNGKIQTANDLNWMFEEDVDYQGVLAETEEQMIPEENGGFATIEAFDDELNLIFKNGK